MPKTKANKTKKTRKAKREYEVVETVVYRVPAGSAQEAIDLITASADRDKWCVSVDDREVVGGPDGWEGEEYEST